ncbi:MAG: hypothetical protein WCE23_16995 [Candidatus Binatus sp.]|uniref:hypothetical protein n=1 Tax=Candidatus Binatus sp. TaxID=2811406 RepID=UPI003C765A35
MKRKIGLVLASGLALLVAGCASQSSSGGNAAPGSAAPTESTARNFNLSVKCPGVHYLKKKGWSDQQIMQQESVEEQDIPACEQWVAAQPKGYVPPPPAGTPVAAKAPSTGGAPAPTQQ